MTCHVRLQVSKTKDWNLAFKTQTIPWESLKPLSFLSLESDLQWKSLRYCLENLPTGGPTGNQYDFPWDLPRANLSRQRLQLFH